MAKNPAKKSARTSTSRASAKKATKKTAARSAKPATKKAAAKAVRPAKKPATRKAPAPEATARAVAALAAGGGKLAQRHAAIWATILSIPPGRVATYGQVADLAGFRKQPRLTAQALAHVPDGMKLPWYRVISASGKSSLPGSAGQREQQRRLEAEGVLFDARGRVDFAVYRWRPRRVAPVVE
jgi:methylated-DNA-protein-cysteine methyltransferase-like protein